jgi:D-tyrosyl-tRNA(Tyr) deacylase
MRAVIQRVKQSSVCVKNRLISRIGPGLLVLLGVADNDEKPNADQLAAKIVQLRIFDDGDGKMNRSLLDTRGEMMVVSQFTLFADCKKGRRPSFVSAAPPEKAEAMYQYFLSIVSNMGVPVKAGIFRAMMEVALINDGPVTIIIESQ